MSAVLQEALAPFTLKDAIREVIGGRHLVDTQMREVMRAVLQGQATPAQIGAFLTALVMKGETVEELTAAAQVLREHAQPVQVQHTRLVDTCGTGGDGAHTFNISTASAIVAAAAGAVVAKHGNRSVSSQSGSADVLEAAGVRLDLPPDQVARCVSEIGLGFLFAPAHHRAMAHVAGPRREIGTRTVFNLLGPLSNPAGARRQVIGVFHRAWVLPLAQVLQRLGSLHVMVVHAEDGLDEISLGAPTHVAELRDGRIATYTLAPEQFQLPRADVAQLQARDARHSLQIIQGVLNDEPGPARDIVVLNAAAAIHVAGVAADLPQAIRLARLALRSGAARAKLQALCRFTQQAA